MYTVIVLVDLLSIDTLMDYSPNRITRHKFASFSTQNVDNDIFLSFLRILEVGMPC